LKKLIYLISPEKIYSDFYKDLNKVLETRKIKFFQLRLKKISKNKTIKIAKKIMKITKIHKVNFLINDSFKIAKIINADGCHLGQLDGSVINAKKSLKNKIIGVTCHNSKLLAKTAIKNKASYVAFGSFGKSLLKPTAQKADLKILKWAKKNIKKPIVAIGGINNSNYKKLIKAGANYIAISSYIWDNPELKPEFAIRKFK
jgi:thiamine-phosphate pyrophosphorylase